MVHHWFRKPTAVVSTPLLLVLALAIACGTAAEPTSAPSGPTTAPIATTAPGATSVPQATAAPQAGKPKVNKLIMSLSTPGWETNLVWAGSIDHHSQHELVMESLVDIEPQTNGYVPELAEKWEMSADGKAFTFWLHKGVQFHDNWGEFTAKDVAHSAEIMKRDDSLMAYVSNHREVDTVEIVNDYQVVLRLKNPDPDYLFYVSPGGGILMQSKAFWDAQGLEGYQKKIIGTGPYLYKGRAEGQSVSYERLSNHWRVKPDWPEFEIKWMPEDANRQAALLAKEVHITELPRPLTDDAIKNKGMKIIKSIHPANNVGVQLGGLHFTTPEKLDQSNPFANIKVRQAMNKAIDKKEMAKAIFSDRVTISPVLGYYPNLPGWDPAWLEKYDQLYGYDPAGAKKLMAEAGYPNGFKTKGFSRRVYGFPEAVDFMQALQIYWNDIGIDMQLEDLDTAKVAAIFRDRDSSNLIRSVTPSYKPVSTQLRLFNYKKGAAHIFEDQRLDTMYEELQQIVDLGQRDKHLREIGTYKLEQFETISLYFYFIEMVVDPAIVDSWPFPGSDGANHGHYDLIRACTQPTPCR